MQRLQSEESIQSASSKTLAWLRATVWLAAVLPLLLFGLVAWHLHQRAAAQAQWRVDSAARIGEEHALKVFETNIALLNRVADALGDDAQAMLRAREPPLHDQLVRMTTGLRQLQGLFVIGSNGRIIANNRVFPAPPIDVSDREFFRHHRTGGVQPYFSEVLTSRTTGEPFFDMSLRRMGADGSLVAVLSASMAPPYFAGFYSELAGQDPDLHVELRHSRGAVLAAWPPKPAATGTALAAAANGPALRSDAPHIVAERPLGTYPVHVVAWIEHPVVLLGWYRQLGLLAAFVLPGTLALTYLAWVALQRTRRSMQLAQQLHSETAQRLHVEDSLRQAQKLEALGRMGGGVAHDFNNLLMVITNNVYLHRRLQPALADSKQLAAIERAVAGGSRLTQQLLSFAGRQALHPERLDLQAQLPAMHNLIAPASGAAVRVEVHVEPDTAAVEVDAAELELALINLAINARDAMPGGGWLRIEAANAVAGERPADAAGDVRRFVVIRVRDSGHGVAPAMIERVFEPFFTTKAAGQGTGLGLAQVYGFCTRAGGTAHFESVVNEGTTVRLVLPAANAAANAAADAPRAPPSAPPLAGQALRGVRVMLVEDNAEVAFTTGAVLESMGCLVRQVDNADQVIDMLRTQATHFDIVLSDIVMSSTQDGIGLATQITRAHPQLPVVLISGYATSLASAAALGLPVLPKPCTPDALLAAVRKALAGKVPAD